MPPTTTFDISISRDISDASSWAVDAGYDGKTISTFVASPFDLSKMHGLPAAIDDWVLAACRLAAVELQGRSATSLLGTHLFSTLFAGRLGEFYENFDKAPSHRSTQQQLWRLRLRIADDFIDLPWELLCRQDSFHLAFDPSFPLVRSPWPPDCRELNIQPCKGPLRALIVIANPRGEGVSQLDVDLHRGLISSAFSQVHTPPLFQLDFVTGPDTLGQLKHKLSQPEPIHLLHFFCGAQCDSKLNGPHLLFEDIYSQPTPLLPQHLILHLRDRQPATIIRGDIRFVAIWSHLSQLNGLDADPQRISFSRFGLDLVRDGIPAALTMQFQLGKDTVNQWVRSFYKALVQSINLDVALARARLDVSWNTADWVAPTLLLHPETDVSTIFQVTRQEKAQSVRPQTRATLRHALTIAFSLEELVTLCFDMGIPYEDLGGDGKEAKVRQLILYCERHDLLVHLIEFVRQTRQDLPLLQL